MGRRFLGGLRFFAGRRECAYGGLVCCLSHETLLSQAGTGTGTSSPDFTMDMTEMNHPASESETELTIKLEDPEELPYQELRGRSGVPNL